MKAFEIRDEIGALAEGHYVAPDALPLIRAAVLAHCETSDKGRQQYVVSMFAVALPNVDTGEVIWPKPMDEPLRDDEVALKALADPALWSAARQQWEQMDPEAWSAFSRRVAGPLVRRLGLKGAWETVEDTLASSAARRFVRIAYPQPDAGPEGRELPFVIGVIADLSGQPLTPLPPLKDRQFTPIDRNCFATVLAAIRPRLAFRVHNVVDGGQLDVELHFDSPEDFEPHGVIGQVEHLRRLADSGDAAVSKQVDVVLNAPEFQRLEATWRGLRLLVSGTEPSECIRILILDASRQTLYRDLVRAQESDRSGLFKLVHDNVYGVSGPTPFGLLVSDAECGEQPADLEFLERISAVTAAIHAPLLASANYKLADIARLQDMVHPTDDYKISKVRLHRKWQLIRKSDDSLYLGLSVGGGLWSFASRLAGSFAHRGSFAALGELEDGADVASPFTRWLPAPDLGSLGFFHGAIDYEKPLLYNSMCVHERPVELLCVLAASRFAHYVKALLTDYPGSFASQEQCARLLNDWIGRYVEAPGELTGRPLKAAHMHISQRGAVPCAVLRVAPVYRDIKDSQDLRLIVTMPAGKIAGM